MRGRVAAAVLSSALSLTCGPGQAKSLHPDYLLLRGEVQAYGDWLAGCDNQGDCTLLGIPGEVSAQGAMPEMAIRISLAGAEGNAPGVELIPLGDAPRPLQPFYLDVEYSVAAITPPHSFSRAELVPLEANAVLAHLAAGKPLVGMGLDDNRPRVRLAGNGFRSAWRAVSARRAALLRAKPAAARHRRLAAAELMVSGFAPIHAVKACAGNAMRDLRRFRFSGGSELWSYRCGDGLSPRTYWQVAPDAMVLTGSLDLPDPRLGRVRAGTNGLENAVFDFDFGILREYRYQPGRKDCGIARAWGFTASGWQLLERREMPLCKGVEQGEWIRTHFTSTDAAGSDG